MPIIASTVAPSPSPAAAPRVGAARQPRRPSSAAVVVAVTAATVVVVGAVLGLTVTGWGVTARHTTIEHRETVDDPWLSMRDRTALGLPASATTMFSPGAAFAVAHALDAAISIDGSPTRFTQLSLYSDDAIAVARDTVRPDRVEQYPWSAGRVGSSSPHPRVDDLDRRTFTVDEVDWSVIGRLAVSAVAMTGVEDGTITHVIIDRSIVDAARPVTIRIYVSGPHSSGFVEASAAGTVLDVY